MSAGLQPIRLPRHTDRLRPIGRAVLMGRMLLRPVGPQATDGGRMGGPVRPPLAQTATGGVPWHVGWERLRSHRRADLDARARRRPVY